MPRLAQRARTLRFVTLYERELTRLVGAKLASYAALLVAGVALGRLIAGAAAARVAVDTLTWLSWCSAGLLTWSAARNWQRFRAPLVALARECAVPESEQRWAAPLALGRRLALTLGIPGLALGVVCLVQSPDLAHAGARVLLLLAIGWYVIALSTGLVLLTQVCSQLNRASPTSSMLTLLVGPELLQQLWPSTPSVVDGYAWLLQRVAELGGVA